jgi:predicted AlkP superfamily phosphohydrolase/phosphomutase
LRRHLLVAGVLAGLWMPVQAHAYIGPGAGFALAGSFLVLLTTLAIVAFTLLTYPFTLLWKWVRVGNPFKHAQVKRVIVLGMDGMDPGLATKFILEGRMPNFKKLAERGAFRPLITSNPSMSPVAWSTFTTGVDASRHGIYDFITRDPCTYGPMLSSTEIGQVSRVLNIGRYVVPLGKPSIRLLQKSQAFWKLLGEKHIFSTIQRVPITFPAVPFKNGLLLSGMCVPDLRGSQGTFSFFSTEEKDGASAYTGGEQTLLRRKGNVIRSRIVGPDNSVLKSGGRMTLPFTLTVADDKQTAKLEIDGCEPVVLEPKRFSDWIRLSFKPGMGITVHGIVRFYLNSVDPHVNLYMTPVNIDPDDPAMPISHPDVYAIYLAKKQGAYATLGLAEDTWALNERVIDEQAFLDYALLILEEREKMFRDAVEKTRSGFVCTVFDTTDRVQHMFYRYLDPTHPANAGKDVEKYRDTIGQVYEKMDQMLGRFWSEIERDDTEFLVISDHGFTNFRRGVNLNAWLRDEGYLVLKDGHTTSGDWFEHIDWTRTRAFAMGLTGLFVNRQGREKSGIVTEGAEYQALVAELTRKLEALIDPATGERCIRRVVGAIDGMDGPYRFDAPDLLVGYEGGYRHSWECATGAVTAEIFSDNTKSWSGDHCVDPDVVPGVLFSSRPLAVESPRLVDIPYTVMRLFGQQPPKYMQGRMIFAEPGQKGDHGGMLDPRSLPQSGSAPGARIFGDEAAQMARAGK